MSDWSCKHKLSRRVIYGRKCLSHHYYCTSIKYHIHSVDFTQTNHPHDCSRKSNLELIFEGPTLHLRYSLLFLHISGPVKRLPCITLALKIINLTRTSSSPIHRPAVWITSTNWPSVLRNEIFRIVVKYFKWIHAENFYKLTVWPEKLNISYCGEIFEYVQTISSNWLSVLKTYICLIVVIYLRRKIFKLTWLCDLFCLHLSRLIFYKERDMRKNLTSLSDPSE